LQQTAPLIAGELFFVAEKQPEIRYKIKMFCVLLSIYAVFLFKKFDIFIKYS